MDISLLELWGHMGVFARFIVLVMAVMSMLTVLVTAERSLVYRRQRKESENFALKMATLVDEHGLDDVAAADFGKNVGYLGRVMRAGLASFKASSKAHADFTFETVARALERQSQRELQTLKRGHGILGTIASTAPFVGLLGTVMGIVATFKLMAESNSSGLAGISAGIAEALYTTAMGLFVAIPAVMAANYLQTWVDARSVDLSESSNELLDLVAKTLKASDPTVDFNKKSFTATADAAKKLKPETKNAPEAPRV